MNATSDKKWEVNAVSPPDAENDLVARAQAGDSSAFSQLLRLHDDKMRGLAYRVLGSQTAMDDVLQDAYLKAYRNIASFRLDAKFSTWLYRIVHTTCIDHHRQRARRPQVSLETVADQHDPSADHATDIARREELQQALSELPPDHLAVVVLIDGEGLSYDAVAETLGINPGTVASRLSRARATLRERLAPAERGNQ